ncbi:MAG: hypothetical protein RL030_2777 [Pseudomonadota bacterium]|jgi:hypothetical protein
MQTLAKVPTVRLTHAALMTMADKSIRRADTALFLARIKRRANICVRVFTVANWLAP